MKIKKEEKLVIGKKQEPKLVIVTKQPKVFVISQKKLELSMFLKKVSSQMNGEKVYKTTLATSQSFFLSVGSCLLPKTRFFFFAAFFLFQKKQFL